MLQTNTKCRRSSKTNMKMCEAATPFKKACKPRGFNSLKPSPVPGWKSKSMVQLQWKNPNEPQFITSRWMIFLSKNPGEKTVCLNMTPDQDCKRLPEMFPDNKWSTLITVINQLRCRRFSTTSAAFQCLPENSYYLQTRTQDCINHIFYINISPAQKQIDIILQCYRMALHGPFTVC